MAIACLMPEKNKIKFDVITNNDIVNNASFEYRIYAFAIKYTDNMAVITITHLKSLVNNASKY